MSCQLSIFTQSFPPQVDACWESSEASPGKLNLRIRMNVRWVKSTWFKSKIEEVVRKEFVANAKTYGQRAATKLPTMVTSDLPALSIETTEPSPLSRRNSGLSVMEDALGSPKRTPTVQPAMSSLRGSLWLVGGAIFFTAFVAQMWRSIGR